MSKPNVSFGEAVPQIEFSFNIDETERDRISNRVQTPGPVPGPRRSASSPIFSNRKASETDSAAAKPVETVRPSSVDGDAKLYEGATSARRPAVKFSGEPRDSNSMHSSTDASHPQNKLTRVPTPAPANLSATAEAIMLEDASLADADSANSVGEASGERKKVTRPTATPAPWGPVTVSGTADDILRDEEELEKKE